MTHEKITMEDLILEADLHALISKLEDISKDIYDRVPNEILFLPSGEPNIRSRWGAVYYHVMIARATLRSFLTE